MSDLPEISLKVREMIDPQLSLNNETLNQVMINFERQIKKGLKKSTHNTSEIKCFITYVQDMPNGTERGKVRSSLFLSRSIHLQNFVLVSST